MINPQTVSQKFSRESTKITKDYWAGFKKKSMTKIGMHDLSDYFDYWKGGTKKQVQQIFHVYGEANECDVNIHFRS